ncbi:carboxymuconolactone decarboxylase family protein [Muricoccus radiodurans]|uniref:carboxymuconolactone decarboxylase family protein n=1 Tax=Muricoccus radiodurans TaxID=2231721 RepID=UPI003CEC18A0
MSEQRFPPIAAEDMNEAQRALAQTIASGPRGGVRGPFLALMHHPVLADRLQALGEHLRYGTGMPDPLVELAIIVTARHWGCQYEWVAHERLARKAGLDPAIIDAVAKGEVPSAMSEDEATVHAFCREALEQGEPSAARYDAAVARFGRTGVLDLLALCGYYGLLATVLNTANPPLPDGIAPPLGALPHRPGLPRRQL